MKYYFNNNTDNNGYHEVHTEECTFLPSEWNRTYIGSFSSCREAITYATIAYPGKTFDGCYFCCYECHKG